MAVEVVEVLEVGEVVDVVEVVEEERAAVAASFRWWLQGFDPPARDVDV
jgi:hypothetical protein